MNKRYKINYIDPDSGMIFDYHKILQKDDKARSRDMMVYIDLLENYFNVTYNDNCDIDITSDMPSMIIGTDEYRTEIKGDNSVLIYTSYLDTAYENLWIFDNKYDNPEQHHKELCKAYKLITEQIKRTVHDKFENICLKYGVCINHFADNLSDRFFINIYQEYIRCNNFDAIGKDDKRAYYIAYIFTSNRLKIVTVKYTKCIKLYNGSYKIFYEIDTSGDKISDWFIYNI